MMHWQVKDLERREKAAQQELEASQFQASSIAGKKLMQKCKELQAENEQLGKELSEGKVSRPISLTPTPAPAPAPAPTTTLAPTPTLTPALTRLPLPLHRRVHRRFRRLLPAAQRCLPNP